ncbi:MAG: hypothetical protein L0Z68_01125 [Gammaproteobacteria bacterium]|nr:hypothetical protein [Gammaproteobacteria bacterium]
MRKKARDLGGLPPSFTDTSGAITKLNEHARTNLRHLDDGLHQHWCLGRNIILNWCPRETGLDVLVVPHYLIATFLATHPSIPDQESLFGANAPGARRSGETFVRNLITGTRQASPETLERIAQLFQLEATHIKLPFPLNDGSLDAGLIDEIIRRYSFSYVENRAVALFDISEFSLYEPFDQMTQLNSLAYSANSAHSKMLNKKITIDFARSTTGDGFYIWNRDSSIKGNMNLYHFMHLILADNAIARSKSKGNTTPVLKTAFHIGSDYEFYQAEGLHPTMYNYIVGDVTIELARIVDYALPGQILVGNFKTKIADSDRPDAKLLGIDTVSFIDRLQGSLSKLRGIELSGEKIESIKCYLTGRRGKDGRFKISKYQITDKHAITRNVYNAKINIYRAGGEPIFLGIQEKDVAHSRIVNHAPG